MRNQWPIRSRDQSNGTWKTFLWIGLGWSLGLMFASIYFRSVRIQQQQQLSESIVMSTTTSIPITTTSNGIIDFPKGPVASSFQDESNSEKEKIKTKFVFIIFSMWSSARRKLARETWLTKLDKKTSVYFFASQKGNDENGVRIENQENGNDVVPLESEGKKSGLLLSSLKYAYATYDFEFLIKVEEDGLVNPMRLNYAASKWQSTTLWTGKCWMQGYAVAHAHAPKEYDECDRYPPFCGNSYVLTPDLVRFVATAQGKLRMLVDDDTSLAVWLNAHHGLKIINDTEIFMHTQMADFKPEIIPNKLWDNLKQYFIVLEIFDHDTYRKYWERMLEISD